MTNHEQKMYDDVIAACQPLLAALITDDELELVEAAVQAAKDVPELATDGELEEAKGLVDDIHELHKQIEVKRKVVKKPFLDAGRKVDKLVKPSLDKLDRAKSQIKARLSEYARKAAAKARAAQEAAAKQAAENEIPEITVDEMEAQADTKKVKTRIFHEFTVEDITKVPAQFLVVDMAKVRKHFAAHGETPAGISVTLEERAVM